MIAFSVGIVSLGVVGALALIGLRDTAAPTMPHEPSTRPTNYSALIDVVLPIGAATAVFFQLFLPVNSGLISVNLADPIVIVAGCIFAYNHFRKRPQWRLAHFNLMICLASVVLVGGYLHGYLEFGWTQWASANRLVGWPILLCYGATGALIVYRMRDDGLDLLLRTFVATSLVVFLFDYAMSIAYWSGARFLQQLVQLPIEGFSQNRNAFSFQLLMSVCILLASHWPRKALWLGIAIAGVFVSGSRAGYLALIVVLALAIFVAPVDRRQGAIAAAIAAMIALANELIPNLVHFIQLLSHAGSASLLPSYMAVMISGASSDTERMASLIGGWQLFIANPVFGAGLGAFMEQAVRLGTPLVIHSTPLWLLAEFGVVGFLVMTAPIVLIFRSEILRAPHFDVAGRLLILIISGFAVMSLAHELLYQRTFWLLLGVAMAMPYAVAKRPCDHAGLEPPAPSKNTA
jgi:hypothetical protein